MSFKSWLQTHARMQEIFVRNNPRLRARVVHSAAACIKFRSGRRGAKMIVAIFADTPFGLSRSVKRSMLTLI